MKLGIIAGAGAVPGVLAARCRANGIPYTVFAIAGQGNDGLAAPGHVFRLGAGASLRRLLRKNAITDAVLIGAVSRPTFWQLRPDWLTLRQLPRLMLWRGGDDGLLRRLATVFERVAKVRLRGVQEFLPELLAPAGVWGAIVPDDQAKVLIAIGRAAALAHGQDDLGQAVIVDCTGIAARETRAGTSALLRNYKSYMPAVLVKMAKPQQDLRLDLPTVGPQTVALAAAVGLAGIAVEAGRTLVVDRAAMVAAADAAGLFLIGLEAS